jgi:hypothetical protein
VPGTSSVVKRPVERAARSRAAVRQGFRWRGFLLLCAIYLAAAALWHTPWVAPLRLFVVLLHEVSHGVAALATGGRVVEIQVFRDEGGQCVSLGGLPVVIASAGYLGSMALGATLLLVATRTRLARLTAVLLGALVALVAWRYMPEDGFGRAFAASCGAALVLLALPPAVVAESALRVIGVTSCLYAILDMKHDLLDAHHDTSDAALLAGLTGVPAVVWGVAWVVVSVVVTLVAAKWAVTGRPGRGVQSARG